MNRSIVKMYKHKTQRGIGCIVLTRNMFHLATLLRYMAVKYTDIYFISIYCSKAAIYHSISIFTTQTVS